MRYKNIYFYIISRNYKRQMNLPAPKRANADQMSAAIRMFGGNRSREEIPQLPADAQSVSSSDEEVSLETIIAKYAAGDALPTKDVRMWIKENLPADD